jgi:hypothetical protein
MIVSLARVFPCTFKVQTNGGQIGIV